MSNFDVYGSVTFLMCQITDKYYEDIVIAKTAERVLDYPGEPSWGLYKTFDGVAVLVDSDVNEVKEALNNGN